jgi:hypothetical protein
VLHHEAYADKETTNAVALMPKDESLNLLADLIKETVTFMKGYFKRPNFSYNLFFYNVEKKMRVKIMPRFATPPMYVGYNIHLRPTSIPDFAENLRAHLKNQGYIK